MLTAPYFFFPLLFFAGADAFTLTFALDSGGLEELAGAAAGFEAGAGAAGLGAGDADLGAGPVAGLGAAADLAGAPFPAGVAGAAAAATAGTAAVASFPLRFFPALAASAACSACGGTWPLAPRPRLGGGGGGGGGGGASGFRYFRISVRERILPSSSIRKTSWAILGYSGSGGTMCSSVISGKGSFCCTCRHLVKKFLIFCSTACWRVVNSRNRMDSGLAFDSSSQVREGVAASLPTSLLASSLASASRRRQLSTRSRRGISFCMSATSWSLRRLVRK